MLTDYYPRIHGLLDYSKWFSAPASRHSWYHNRDRHYSTSTIPTLTYSALNGDITSHTQL